MPKIRLDIWRGDKPTDAEPAPRPTPADVLYANPNEDGTRKMCQNCLFWLASDQQCVVHTPDVAAAPEAVCGYHVFGQPNFAAASGERFGNMAPEETGFLEVPGGTSCDLCRWYTSTGPKAGTCAAVCDPDTSVDAAVAALGCCARWEMQDDGAAE